LKTIRASVFGFGIGCACIFILGANSDTGGPPATPGIGLSEVLAAEMGLRAGAPSEELIDHTFSIVAFDPETGEVGVAVTTRNACVGNRVPWVRAGVGAVATQASTRPEYGKELLDLMESGNTPQEALDAALSADPGADRRQVGVVGISGGTAQHTGSVPGAWAGERMGRNFAAQGNVLVGPEVLDEVTRVMEETEGSGRVLADRLILALEAGHAAGGDRRKGRRQSAAVLIADPRPGQATRPDGESVFLHICEHPEPVGELRRQFESVSETLGYRSLQQFSGSDVWQLKLILHALGFFRPGEGALSREEGLARGDGADDFNSELAAAVDAFRLDRGLSTPEDGSPSGLVDSATVDHLWLMLEEKGMAVEMREMLRDATHIRN
jgi:uncharacterized Ntn-hydrolase superfamily protein